MFNQQSTIFPKQIKLDDYEPYENNHLIILQSSNLLLGSGSRTSNAAIVLAKALHYLVEQGRIYFKGKSLLELGCGVGLVGLYLAALGTNVALCDTSALKDLVQKNININRKMLNGKVEFHIVSWNKTQCLGNCKQSSQFQAISTVSSDKHKQSCLYHLVQKYDYTLVCQCGGLVDLQSQLKIMGKEGMFLSFMKRQNWDDGLDQRTVEQYLNQNTYEYEKIDTYHPDYVDHRISIFKIYPIVHAKQVQPQKMVNQNQIQQEHSIGQRIQKLQIQDKIPTTD